MAGLDDACRNGFRTVGLPGDRAAGDSLAHLGAVLFPHEHGPRNQDRDGEVSQGRCSGRALAALLVMATTRRARRTYIEHLYFTLHVHAALFALLTVLWLLEALSGAHAVLSWTSAVLLTTYLWLALREAYGGGAWLTTGRTLVLAFSYPVAVLMALAIIGVLALGGAAR